VFRNGSHLRFVGNALQSIDRDIQNNIEYTYTVKAEYNFSCVFCCNMMFHNVVSNEVRFSRIANPPTNLSYQIVTNGDVILSWDAPVDNSLPPLGYRVHRDNENISGQTLLTRTTFPDSDVQSGVEYSYHVVAVYPGSIGHVRSDTITVMRTYQPPLNLRATKEIISEQHNIFLRWDPPANSFADRLSGYRIYRDGIPITRILISPTATSIRDRVVNPWSTYRYHVRAIYDNPQGESELSNYIDVSFTSVVSSNITFNASHLFNLNEYIRIENNATLRIENHILSSHQIRSLAINSGRLELSATEWDLAYSTVIANGSGSRIVLESSSYLDVRGSTININGGWLTSNRSTIRLRFAGGTIERCEDFFIADGDIDCFDFDILYTHAVENEDDFCLDTSFSEYE
jgi:hypothetical protein